MNLSFLNPGYLWALPLALGPLVIHLLSRRAPHKNRFSDLRFIRQALEKAQNRILLRRYLLLAARMLALLCLVGYFCRPIFHLGAASGGPGGTGLSVIMLLDVSYSMGYREADATRFEKEKGRAAEILRRLPADARIGIIAYSDRVESATPNLTSDRRSLNDFIEAVHLSSRSTDISVTVPVLRRLQEQFSGRDQVIIVLSDNAQHAYRAAVKEPLGQRTRIITFLPAAGQNLRFAGGSARFNEDSREWEMEVSVEGETPGGETSWPVGLFSGGRKIYDDLVRPSGKGAARRTFSCAAEDEILFSGKAELSADRLPCDNHYFLAAARPPSCRLWIVDGDPRFGGVAAESYYLHAAFPAADVVPESEAAAVRFDPPGVVVLANVRENVASVETFVAKGGGAVVFPGGHSVDSIAPAYMSATLGVSFEETQSVVWSAPEHPLSARFPAKEFEWQKIAVDRGYVLTPKEDAEVLARLSSGRPFLVEGSYGQGKVAVFASTADREWNNLVSKPLYLPFMKSLVRHLSGLSEAAANCSLKIGEPFVHKAVPDAAVRMPSGKRIALPAAQTILFTDTDEPGIYTLLSGGREVEHFAVNLDASSGEGDLAAATKGKIRSFFRGSDVLFLTDENWMKDLTASVSGNEISQYLLVLAVLFLLVEVLLANPGKRRLLVIVLFLAGVFPSASVLAQQGDPFVFAQLQYEGEWDPYPETWQDILEFTAVTTSIKAVPERRVLTVDDRLLFSSPFITILGTGRFPRFSENERNMLRKYLANGGLLFVEDSAGIKGGSFDASFRREITKIYPEARLKKLPQAHPLYRSYYLLRKTGGRRLTNNYLEGIESGGRTVLVYSQNDLIGAWAKDRLGNYLWDCVPGGQEQRFEAQKLTLNLVMYSVTGTYKSDAIHTPYLEQKLGQ